MSRLAAVANLASGDVLPESWVDAVMTIANYLAISGADLASAGTLNITSYFHKVTGTTTIDNIGDTLGAISGQRVKLAFQGTTQVRHNGGGTGNIRLVGGLHAGFVAGETLELVYDGTNWIESHRSPVHLSGEQIEHGAFAGGTTTGYLINDGSAVSRTTYSALFGNIGTNHGAGDGSTTFNLPDDRGRVTVGWAQTGGHADVSTIGANEGVTAVNRRPKHRTSKTDTGHSHNMSPNNDFNSPNDITDGGNTTGGHTTSAYGVSTANTTTGITVGTGNANDPLDTPAYIVKPKLTRI